MEENGGSEWYDDYADQGDDTDGLQIEEYDITASPNDFNVMTLCSYIDSGSVRIPGFQRNFVWDIRRASRLIESLILGLPVPQLFLHEQERRLPERYTKHIRSGVDSSSGFRKYSGSIAWYGRLSAKALVKPRRAEKDQDDRTRRRHAEADNGRRLSGDSVALGTWHVGSD